MSLALVPLSLRDACAFVRAEHRHHAPPAGGLFAVGVGDAGEVFAHSPFTVTELRRAIANGVPLPMGRAVAKAVKRALSASTSPSGKQGVR